MCGICGIVGFEDKGLLKRMCDVISHRGPDDWGLFIDKNIGVGNRRLSIIDLKGGHQPIHKDYISNILDEKKQLRIEIILKLNLFKKC